MEKGISHTGTVKSIQGNRLHVEIVQVSACGSCQAKSLCRISEMKEKTVEVVTASPEKYRVGQAVTVCGSERQGMKAVLLAFGLPLLLTVLTIAASMSLWNSEKTAVLLGLAVLAAYWTALFVCRDRIGKDFAFSITE